MEKPEYHATSFTCSNCGQIILDNILMNKNSKVRIPKFYCAECYYRILQANKHLITRMQLMKNGRVNP